MPKIKKIYVWDNLVRPKWEPWANTLAYYKFENNLDDSSWNSHTLTNSWAISYDNKSVVLASNAYLYCNNFSDTFNHDRTISVWIYVTSRAGDNSIYFSKWTWAIRQQLMGWVTKTWYSGMWFYGEDINWTTATSLNTWYNIISTYNYSTRKYNNYVNAVNDVTWTLSAQYSLPAWNTFNIWAIANSTGNTNYRVYWKLTEYIIEKKEWTQTDVTNYFNLTKWRFWY